MQIDLPQYWYRRSLHPLLIFLVPFTFLFALLIWVRRQLYRVGVFKVIRFPVPVIIVGNITVGGTGKTPLAIYLAKLLAAHGYRPGIVSRGVGGKKQLKPHSVTLWDKVSDVGDEALLLVRETNCPLVICTDRVAAVRMLLRDVHCDVVISDDGLQHYRLGRAIEIAVMDGTRGLGNGYLLPAGPLREPVARLQTVDFIVVRDVSCTLDDRIANLPCYHLTIRPDQCIALKSREAVTLQDFQPKCAHAVTAIGNPNKFFDSLIFAGFQIKTHAFPDHYLYHADDFKFHDALPIIMTAKDAVKCETFCDARFWYISTTVQIDGEFESALMQKVSDISLPLR